jgi:hypothetical protein
MVYNATFNNISVLLVDLVGVFGENKAIPISKKIYIPNSNTPYLCFFQA